MTTLSVSSDGHAIALACTTLALQGDRSLKPLTAAEWHELSLSMRSTELRPRDLLGLSPDELRQGLGLPEQQAERLAALLARGGQLALELERLAARGIWVVTRADEAYPPLLKERLRGQAPPVLFGAGPPASLQLPSIAIVGSRDVDDEGLEFASSLGQRCAEAGFAVVSGAARGVDLTAMHGALSYGGPAVGITVDPLERLVQRAELRSAVADELLTLATPFHPSARWYAGNAMRRNRLIYALSQAAVVVASSPEKGGTRAGARENLEAGWVPLHVRDDGGAGNSRLISEGATPLPADEPIRQLDVERLAQRPQVSLLDSGSLPPSPAPNALEAPIADDAFQAVWPILARFLREPIGERDVAEKAELQLTQARVWLHRAVAEGYLEVKPRPKRYVLRGFAEQLHIDDA